MPTGIDFSNFFSIFLSVIFPFSQFFPSLASGFGARLPGSCGGGTLASSAAGCGLRSAWAAQQNRVISTHSAGLLLDAVFHFITASCNIQFAS